MDNMSGMDMGMRTYYYFGSFINQTVVFPGLTSYNQGDTAGICFLAIAFVLTVEACKWIRINFTSSSLQTQDYKKVLLNPLHIIDSLIYGFQMWCSYTVMLFVMTFNAYLIMSVCLAYSLAHWIFGFSIRKTSEVDIALIDAKNEDCC